MLKTDQESKHNINFFKAMSKTKKNEEEVEYTGRYIVLMPENSDSQNSINQINAASGLNLKNSTEFDGEIFTEKDLDDCDGILLDKIGVAIVNKNPKFESAIAGLSVNSNMVVEPERVVYATGILESSSENYIKGYRDAVNSLADILLQNPEEEMTEEEEAEISAVGATWGLKATKVIPSTFMYSNPYSGAGIKVAILDTGFDLAHPDFVGRPIVHQSFVSGQAVQDGHGHGTHCTGTACGPLNPTPAVERYGIAYNASIYIGKVLNNAGSGGDGGILAGINWAIANGCAVISMSLGGNVSGAGYSAVYENVAVTALNNGCLIIAAAGNASSRPGVIKPVSHPANCPSIMAVGAVDSALNVANFSCGGLFPTYGAVDIAGPGVGVFSSVKMPARYATWNGTSMATPHVAGIAALWAQSSGVRGMNLWRKLTSTAKPLTAHPTRDVGAGLVQAPNKRRILEPFPRPFPIKRPIPPFG
jgi:subtilisin family serine protease